MGAQPGIGALVYKNITDMQFGSQQSLNNAYYNPSNIVDKCPNFKWRDRV